MAIIFNLERESLEGKWVGHALQAMMSHTLVASTSEKKVGENDNNSRSSQIAFSGQFIKLCYNCSNQ